MIINKPYQQAQKNTQPYNVIENFNMKDPNGLIRRDLKSKYGGSMFITVLQGLWEQAYTREEPFFRQEEIIPNALVPVEKVMIWEYWGQRNALERVPALRRLAKAFDYRMFEPVKIAKLYNEDTLEEEYYCYDGGGRVHLIYSFGVMKVPATIVTVQNKDDLQALFMDQTKYVTTISTRDTYVQHLAKIDHTQDDHPKTWYEELDQKHKNSYSLCKLLKYCNMPLDASEIEGLKSVGKYYSTFSNQMTKSSPNPNRSVTQEAKHLADSLSTWQRVITKNFVNSDIFYKGSLILYIGATLWRLDQLNTNGDKDLSYNKLSIDIEKALECSIKDYKKTSFYDPEKPDKELKNFYDYFIDREAEGLSGESSWGKKDKKPNDTAFFSFQFKQQNLKACLEVYNQQIPTIF